MTWGQQRELLVKLRDAGKPVPALDEEPEIGIVENWYIDAYLRLSERNIDNQIKISDMKNYIDMFGNIGTADEFVDIIRMIESEVIDNFNKRSK